MTPQAPDPRSPTKGRAVRGMFAAIAPRYDLLNRLLSFGLDQRWRKALLRRVPTLAPGERILDLCAGTGDVALALDELIAPDARVHASDFCEQMLALTPAKQAPGQRGPALLVSDAQALPYGPGCFRAVTVAFGLRNVEDPSRALAEMARVLVPGGRLAILEFSRPRNRVFALFYRLYFFRILPAVGRMISGSSDAYRYLPESVWAFSTPSELGDEMQRCGLTVVEQRAFLMGAVHLHVAERPRQ